ncbi:DUF998 domain-containing protein [Sphaerisporangium album]|uniref:DUF998 domain-containing protein n=1 Tax=Sphaerisporangium album TaxID=509200 RepID=A0A367FFC4_9ACTN|nr:DUF998 domain-containing protein [Sphaerisporangium album]RCG28599.1 DUF998 domain-containing protein [Sphaerisporangium album]
MTADGGPLWRRLAPAAGLFFLAPLIGEFVLGNVPLSGIVVLPFYALLYGTGALLVREVARRTGGGWPAIVLLAAAYALIEEGPVDQLLWNDSYAGHDYLHTASYIPALGTSVAVVQTILSLHTIWSICVPIAIAEAFVPRRDTTPWLGRAGLAVVAVVFVLDAVLVFWATYAEERFLASPAQFAGAGLVIAALVAAALRLRGDRPGGAEGDAPPAWAAGVAALVATSLWWGPAVLAPDDRHEWAGVAVWVVLVVAGVLLVSRWSRRRGWGPRHRFALAAGATLTYVWAAFPNVPEVGAGSAGEQLAGDVVFGTVAVVILALAWWRLRADDRTAARSRL